MEKGESSVVLLFARVSVSHCFWEAVFWEGLKMIAASVYRIIEYPA